MEYAKRLVVPLILLIILVASWMSPLDTLSSEQVDAGLKRSLASFAIARSLNAVISVAQGTDVAIQPAGIGVKFAPGEILDPINDLIETFSTLMLFASISFGVQKVLISVGGHWLVSVALSLSVLLWAVLHAAGRSIPRWCTALLVVTLLVRFAVPVATVGSSAMFQQFLAADYVQSQTFLEQGAEDARKKAILDTEPPGEQGLLDRLLPKDLNVKDRINDFKKTAELWTEKMIKLTVVFLLETMIFPLLLLWALARLAKGTLDQLSAIPDEYKYKA
jgi:hypothetical protein